VSYKMRWQKYFTVITERKNVAFEMFDKVSLLCYWNVKQISGKDFEWLNSNICLLDYTKLCIMWLWICHFVVQPHGKVEIALTYPCIPHILTGKRLLLLHHAHFSSFFWDANLHLPHTPPHSVCILLADILTKTWDLFWIFNSWVPLQ